MASSLSLVRRPLNPAGSWRRILSFILMLYILWMYSASRFMFGDWTTAVFWSGGPPGALFPIPMYPGILEIIVIANPVDSFLFLFLFQTGLWISLEVLLAVLAFSPYTIARSRDS
ncbi:MAG: hypothetical protein ACW974_06675 [Candidatus Thorarchaeota archaeon]|jgi:hypothetical protein